jgi:hypothetical protein
MNHSTDATAATPFHYRSYLNGKVPAYYVCSTCAATGCKLWRKYQSISIELVCARCAAINQNISIEDINANGDREGVCGPTDQIGWYVPAVPVEGEIGYSGYPWPLQPGDEWWRRLPTLLP